MTEIVYQERTKNVNLNLVPEVIFHPRKAFQVISSMGNPKWITPLIILSIIVLINVLVGGKIKNQAAMMGEITYPPDFQYYTPEKQAQYIQAIQSTQSPVFTYVLPAITSIAGVWFGWLVLGGVLHFLITLLGGRGSITTSMNIVAWASLPFAIRKLAQVMYIFFTNQLIENPGLSGFSAVGENGWLQFLRYFLSLVDIYIVWQIMLIILGVQLSTKLNRAKSTLGVLISVIVILFLQSGISYLFSFLSNITITRPFFF